MAANIEGNNMFSVREIPWHKMGTVLPEAPKWEDVPYIINGKWSAEKVNAIQMLPAGITSDLQVVDTTTGEVVGYIRTLKEDFEIRRNTDGSHFGFVKDSYVVLQNDELIDLAREMAGLGAKPETAGFLDGGRTMWLCVKTEDTVFAEEAFNQYFVLTNTHGGGGAIRAVISPVRVVCQNTLNAALSGAQRSWAYRHTTNVRSHVDEAVETLKKGSAYMEKLGEEVSSMKLAGITEAKAREVLDQVIIQEMSSKLAKIETLKKIVPMSREEKLKNLAKIETLQSDIQNVHDDLYRRYFNAPDLQHMGHNQFRLWNAISDYATHTSCHKNTKDYQSNLFKATLNDNNSGKAKLIDLGYKLAKAA